jgi:cobalt-zinc-cadmium efflux system membrane fusion protein
MTRNNGMERTKMKSKITRISLVGVLIVTGCGNSTGQKSANPPPGQPGTGELFVATDVKGIRTIIVQPRAIPEYLEIPGRVIPDPTRVVHVFPAATGRVIEMMVKPWDRVQKGQTLALIESSDASRAMADYQKAHSDADLKQKALVRASDLFAHQAISEKDLEQARADAQSANAEVSSALDLLHLLGVDPAGTSNQLRVLAPRSGVVLDIGSSAGELSKSVDSPQPLCTLADLDTVWVEGEIFEKDVNGLKSGAPVEITLNAYQGETWKGRVSTIGDAVDPVTRTMIVRVELANPQLRLKPDMFATLRLVRSMSQGLLIPATSVEREGDDAYVYVGAGENRFKRSKVVLGRTVDDNIEVTSGLTAGSVIVSEGVVLLRAAAQD